MKPIVLRIKSLAASERKITAEIIDCIREIEIQKIHLEMGYPSLMDFLVRECGYSETAALRRIDAARIVKVIPELRIDLKNGDLNLSQISLVAQSVRQKEKLGEKVSVEFKKNLMEAVKNKKGFETQQIVAQMLDLPVVKNEKVRVQADESVRVEISLSKQEMEVLKKAKEILGHFRPGMTTKELVVLLAERFVNQKDPARSVRKRNSASDPGISEARISGAEIGGTKFGDTNGSGAGFGDSEFGDTNDRSAGFGDSEFGDTNERDAGIIGAKIRDTEIIGAKIKDARLKDERTKVAKAVVSGSDHIFRSTRRISASLRRQIFQRDNGCQARSPITGLKCGSRHLLEVDHRIPRWAGGIEELGNLELKCRAHNQWKYREESGIRARANLPVKQNWV